MKLVGLLMFCAVAASAAAAAVPSPSLEDKEVHQVQVASMDAPVNLGAGAASDSLDARDGRNILVDIFMNQAVAYLRRIINNGSPRFGFPPLDPLDLEHHHLHVPLGLIDLQLELHNVHATGFGGFVAHRNKLEIRDLTLEVDVTFPVINAKADLYDFVGDLFTAIPLFGKGEAEFLIEDLRIKALLYLKRSEDGNSILIDHIENASFELPNFKAHLSGVIGGGDIDAIVNSMIQEVVIDYVRRFNGALSIAGANLFTAGINPLLDRLDTWRYIQPFL